MPGLDNKLSNIIGTKLPQWVLKQLETRANKNNQDSRDNDNLLYLANKSAWVRLVSSINIIPELDIQYFKRLVGDDVILDETSLAKNFVLFGGTSKYLDKNSYQLRSGINKNGAYGILGNSEIQDFGYRPMPGITSVTIETQGRLGSVRAATINFKCWDKNQLDIIDALYFKLGFTMFLEWGHTYFYPSPENKQRRDPNKILSTELYSIDPFEKGLNKEDIQIKIAQNSRDSEGNYDAMLGIVTNFNFTYNQDGGYDCTLRLMALGVLGDSIRINNSGTLPELLREEILKLNNTLIQINTPIPPSENNLVDEQNKIDEKLNSILAFLNSQINPSTIPGLGGGYPDNQEQYEIKTLAGILNSSFEPNTANIQDYDFIYYLTGSSGYTLFSQKLGVQIPTNNTSTYVSSIILDRNKLVEKLNTIYYGQQAQFTLNPQNQPLSFNPQASLLSLPLEKLVVLNSNNRLGLLGVESNNLWTTKNLTYTGKNGKKYIIKIEVDLPDIKYSTPDPKAGGISPQGIALSKTREYYAFSEQELYQQTINYILNSPNFDQVFPVENTKIFINTVKKVLDDTKIFNLVDSNLKPITNDQINSTQGSDNTPSETYALLLKGNYSFKVKKNKTTTQNTQAGIVTGEEFAEQDAKNPVEYKIYIFDTDLISNVEPGTDVPLFSDYNNKLTSQNQQQTLPEENQKNIQNAVETQIKQALNYQSTLEIMLRTIQLHALNKAINKTENPDLEIGRTTYVLEIWNPRDTVKQKTFLNQIFSTGVFSTFIEDLVNNKISDAGYTTDKKMIAEERFKIQSKYGFASSLMGNKEPINLIQPVNFKELLKAYVVPYQINQEIIKGTNTNHPVYIPLGLLLMILNHACTIYDTKDGSNFQTPLIYIDFNPEMNFCLTNAKQLSTDPWTCLIPFEGSFEDYKKLFDEDILIDKGKFIASVNGTTEKVPLFNPDTQDFLSGTLPKLKFDTQPIIVPSFDPLSGNFELAAYVADSGNPYRGKLMNILLNIDYLVDKVQQYSYKDGTNSVYLKTFIEQILTDVNKSLGNFNAFRLSYNDSANTFQIVDDQFVPALANEEQVTPKSNTTQLPLLGKFSIAKNLEIKSEVSSKLSNMLAISANANSKNQATLSTNGDPFGFVNTSYVDRYISNRTEITGSRSNKNDTFKISAAQFNAAISDFYSKINPSQTNVSHATNYYIEKMSGIKNDEYATRASAMIPVSVNFTTDGISGLSMGQSFTIPDKLLPYTYTTRKIPGAPIDHINNVGFVMVGLTHTIENNSWNTAVKANMIFLKDSNTEFTGSVVKVESRVGAFGINQESFKLGVDDTIFLSNTPWSAAFISYVMQQAGINFPSNASHVGYLNSLKSYTNFELLNPIKTKLQVGDIVVYNRANTNGTLNTQTFSSQTYSGNSHGDIIVSVSPDLAVGIGGNVSDSVTKTNYTLSSGIVTNTNIFVIARHKNDSTNIVDIANREFNLWSTNKWKETIVGAKPKLKEYYTAVGINFS